MGALCKKYRNDAVGETAVLVEAGDFNLIGWNLINNGASNAYLKLYNAATSGAVTVGTTTPVKTLCIPANGTVLLSNELMAQDSFNNGIVIAVTGAMLDSDTSAPASDCYVELLYLSNS